MKKNVNEAIILAAGKGSRLYPLTKDITKCMVKVNGITIIENMLNKLAENNFVKVTIVVGYLSDVLEKYIGNNYKNMDIKYILNDKFEETNNIYSLYLALKSISDSVLVLESDIFLGEDILENKVYDKKIMWYVDSSINNIGGSYTLIDNDYKVIKQAIIRNLNEITEQLAKSMGIIYIDKNIVNTFKTWIEEEMEIQGKDIYYDLVLQKHLNENIVYAKDNESKKWWEIDDIDDLKKAEEMFK